MDTAERWGLMAVKTGGYRADNQRQWTEGLIDISEREKNEA